MDRVAAYRLIATELATYQSRSVGELLHISGHSQAQTVCDNGVDYSVTVTIRPQDDGGVRIHAEVHQANWGAPHDSLEDEIIVPPPAHL